MPNIAIHHATFVSEKTRRRNIASGISSTTVGQIKTLDGRLLATQTATIAFTSRVSLTMRNKLTLSVLFTNGPQTPTVFTNIKGFLYLPGPGTIVLTNPTASPDAADGGVDFIAIYD